MHSLKNLNISDPYIAIFFRSDSFTVNRVCGRHQTLTLVTRPSHPAMFILTCAHHAQ